MTNNQSFIRSLQLGKLESNRNVESEEEFLSCGHEKVLVNIILEGKQFERIEQQNIYED
jgi:hypothetical protein